MCRRATGGPFAVLAWFSHEAVRWVGEPTIRRSSPIAERGFCRACGTPLLLRYDGSDKIAILAGTLDNPERLSPTHHYGVESRLKWADCGSELPAQRTQETF